VKFAKSKPDPKPKQLTASDVPIYRRNILKMQKGYCPICMRPAHSPVLDHSHRKRIGGSGLIRGVLCRSCNVFLAKSENNSTRYGISSKELPNTLRAMAEYLEKPHMPYIHPSEKPREPKLTKISYNRLKKKMTSLGKTNCPCYPKSGKLTVPLKKCFDLYEIVPEFYGGKSRAK
jgi:hypothetical protein